jgi:iron complex outermembrane receptor protein
MKIKRNKLWASIVIGAVGLGASSVYAASVLEEIVVTSRKTQESLQSIPVAVTAMSSEAIEHAQILNVSDIQGNAPSVSLGVGSPGSSGFVFAAIRGQSGLDANTAVDPSVATYIDGVYIARPAQGTASLDDLERIEILRGPQGTLFGRNTTGGAISIITKNPTDEFEGNVSVGIGSDSLKEVAIRLNVPVSDSTAFRINYKHSEDDGWANNTTLNREIGSEETHVFNGKLRVAPTDSEWSLVLAGDYSTHKDDGQVNQLNGVNPVFWQGFSANPAFPPELQEFLSAVPQILAPEVSNGSNLDQATAGYFVDNPVAYLNPGPIPVDQSAITSRKPFDELEVYGGSATIEGKIADLDFKSITAYRYSNSEGLVDFDGSSLAILASSNGYKSEQWSQEFQISGDLTENLSFISGMYYSTEDGEEFSENQPFGILGAGIAKNDGDIKNETFGIYLQSNLDITDNLEATAGIRWTWDEREVDLHNISLVGAPGDVDFISGGPPEGPNCNVTEADTLEPCSKKQSESFDYPAWTFSLNYQVNDDTMVYAKTSRAAKAGGWNLRIGAVPAFDPEELTDIEFGIKTDLSDNVRLNAAYFHSWNKDVQRAQSVVINNDSSQYLVNAGDTQIDGVELELVANLWEGMQVSFNGSWMDGSYDNGTFSETQEIPGFGYWEVDRSDEAMLQTPEFQFGISGTQRIPLDNGEAVVHLAYKWIDEQYFSTSSGPKGLPDPQLQAGLDALYDGADEFGKIDSYGLLNGSISFNFDGGVSISLWGNNLLDEEYFTRSYGDFYTTLGVSSAFASDPRTYGIKVKYSF